MSRLYELSIRSLIPLILIIAINVLPSGAANIPSTEIQVQKPEQSAPSDKPVSNYKSRLIGRNKAAKLQTEKIKARKTKSENINHGLKKRKLSRHDRAVIRQHEAAKKKRELIKMIDAGNAPKQ